MDEAQRQRFVETVWDYYAAHGRDLPWRQPDTAGTFDPYKIMVSEIMLQQTQVNRVIEKYREFLTLFPDTKTLAAAPLSAVLTVWSGLGYNRRAKFLWQAARAIEARGTFPQTQTELTALPGIGINTAGAIMAYAYNQPVIFIETNIRTVYISSFLADSAELITDKQIIELAAATLQTDEPRQWYWALMDYGSHLKRTAGNSSRLSKTYTKQSTFVGSKRQIRGQVLKALLHGPMSAENIMELIEDERLPQVLVNLTQEQLIEKTDTGYQLTSGQ